MQRITIAPSVGLAAVLGIAHIAAAGLLWLVPIPVVGKAVLTLAIAISLVYFMARDAALHAPHSIVALEIRDGGQIAMQTRDGEWCEGELLGSSYVSPHLTIINLRPRGHWGTWRVLLTSDNVDAEDFRRVRLWLRWDRGESHRAPDR